MRDVSQYKVEVFQRENSKEYHDLFMQCPGACIQQSVYWSDIISSCSSDIPYFITVRDKTNKQLVAGLPLYYYNVKYGGILTSVPYPGPLGGAFADEEKMWDQKEIIYDLLLNAAIELVEKLKCIALTIITNPFNRDADLYKYSKRPDYTLNNFCQVISLSERIDTAGNYTTGKSVYNNEIRRNIKKFNKTGLSVDWADIEDFEGWYSIHEKRHNEIGATPLPKKFLENILRVLNPVNKGNLAIIKKENKIIGGCIYIWHKEIADVFILSGDSEYMDEGINYAITDFSIKFFNNIGVKWYNWQSCKRGTGLYAFKEKWGSKEFLYQFLTWKFKGFEKIFNVDIEELTKAYQWHYLAPFEAIKNKCESAVCNK